MKKKETDTPADVAAEPTAEAQADGTPGEAPAAEAPAAPADPAEFDELRREVDALRDRHLRLAAEFDNYRKRSDRERAEIGTRAQATLVEKLLDVLDDLHRTADVQPDATSVTALLEGIQLVERKLYRALEAAGLESVDAEGKPFDPTVHEALVMTPTDAEHEDETVAQVFQPGYLFKGTLLRPARVQVKRFGG